jgi:quercetin dioxygenase-like cupin family protein
MNMPLHIEERALYQNDLFKVVQLAGAERQRLRTRYATGEQFMLVKKGRVIIHLNGMDHELSRGKTLVVPAGQPYGLRAMTSFEVISVMSPSVVTTFADE